MNDNNLHISNHPLIQDRLTRLRDKNCNKVEYKACLEFITAMLVTEITRDLELVNKNIETPVASMTGKVLKNPPVIVPILRAALGMSGTIEAMIPEAATGHIGVYRDEKTKNPVEYLVKLPPLEGRFIYLVDPMLATGGSALYAMSLLEKAGADMSKMKFVGLIASPEGIEKIREKWPDMPIHMAALDDHLNEKAYIVPGLGDAGDRLFGTL